MTEKYSREMFCIYTTAKRWVNLSKTLEIGDSSLQLASRLEEVVDILGVVEVVEIVGVQVDWRVGGGCAMICILQPGQIFFVVLC